MSIVLDSPFAARNDRRDVYITVDVDAVEGVPVRAMERRSDALRMVVRERMMGVHRPQTEELWLRLAKGVDAAREGRFTDLTGLSDKALIDALC